MKIGQSAGKSLAYLTGVFLGDGCVTKTQSRKEYTFRLNTIDRDFAEAVEKCLRDLDCSVCINGPYKDKRFSKSKPLWQLSSSNQELCLYLKAVTDNKKCIPGWIFNASREEQKLLIIGLMDSEGFVCEGKTVSCYRHYMGFKSCDVWLPQMLELLQKLGIAFGKVSKEKPRKKGYKTSRRFHIKLKSWIENEMFFNIERKNSRVQRWKELRLTPEANMLGAQGER